MTARRAEPGRYLITGCASGIGRHLAGVLVGRGERVMMTDINEEALAVYAASLLPAPGGQVLHRRLDVRDPAAWDATVAAAEAELGGLDVLLNVAGYLRPGLAHEATPEEVSLHLDVNAKGVIYGTQAAARRMVARGAGHIINIGSLAALSPVPGLSLYSAAKFAVRGFTLSAAMELRPLGVALTLVCPDAVHTPMLELQRDYEEAALTFSGERPLTVEEVGDVVLGEVLSRRPLEVSLPGGRGLLARLSGLAPGAAALLLPALRKKGLAGQARFGKR